MKKNYLYLLLLLALVSIVFYLVKFKMSTGSMSNQVKDFSVSDTAAIQRVAITDKAGRILVLKRSKTGWVVNDSIAARKDIVAVLMETLKRMEIKAPVNKAMRENVMKALATGSIKVQVFDESSLLKCFFVGGPTAEGTGTFMILEKAAEPVVVHIPGFEGYLTVRFNTNPEIWRDREIFRYHPKFIDVIKVEYPTNPKSSFSLKVQSKDYISLTNGLGEVATTGINADFLRDYLSQYTDVQYENRIQLPKSTRDSVLIANNLLSSITLIDKEGIAKNVKIYKRFWNGSNFVQAGLEADFDIERVFVLIDNKLLVNGQYRTFNRLIVQYQDFFNAPVKAIN